MTARISGVIQESIVDGPGMRATVFFQGCPHHCEGCHNPQTHDPSGGTEKEVSEILKPILENIILDGVTLSGGEPFMQAEAALEIAKAAHSNGLSVWTYTGYTFEQITASANETWKELLNETDVLVDGRFVKSQKTLDKPFVGSKNQRLVLVSETLQQGKIVEFNR